MGHVDTAGVALARQVGDLLYERGEMPRAPLFGEVVVEAQPGGRTHVFWRLPGPPLFKAVRRRRYLRRYERLLRSWGLATEVRADAPEPYLACWIRSEWMP